MNDRIRKLAKKSGFSLDATHIYTAKLEHLPITENMEKFAELIVKECLDISHRESHLPDTVLFDERSDKFIKDIHNRIDRATREHFGVEE